MRKPPPPPLAPDGETPPQSDPVDSSALDTFVVAAFSAYSRAQQAEQRAYYESDSQETHDAIIANSNAEFMDAINTIDIDTDASQPATPTHDEQNTDME